MLSSVSTSSFDAVSKLASLPSTSSLKTKLKDVFNRGVSEVKIPSENKDNDNGPIKRESTSDFGRNKVHSSMARKEFESALLYFQGVVRTDKIEMLAGSTSMILDSLLKLVILLNMDNQKCQHLYSSIVIILQWTDSKLAEKIASQNDKHETTLQNDREKIDEWVGQVRRSLENILDNSRNRRSCTPPVPSRINRKKRPLSSGHRRKISPPISTDSGIFNEEMRGNSVQLMDDFQQHELMDQFTLIDEDEKSEKQDEKVNKKHVDVRESEDGSYQITTRTSTVTRKISTSRMIIATNGLKMNDFDTKNDFMSDIDSKIDVKPTEMPDFCSNNFNMETDFFAVRSNSPHDNFDLFEHKMPIPPPIPPRISRPTNLMQNGNCGSPIITRNRRLFQQSATLQSVVKKERKRGELLVDDLAYKLDRQQLEATQFDTFYQASLVSRKGGGNYREDCLVSGDFPSGHRSRSSSPPPPLPPKRRAVVQYMRVFGDSAKHKGDQDEQHSHSALVSYVQLRDNLRHYEEQYRKRTFTFQFDQEGTTIHPHNLGDLSDFLHLSDWERLRLPTRFDDEQKNEILERQKAITFPERLALLPPTVLETVDASDWLVLRANDGDSKTVEIRGGPKDALIAFATQPTGSSLLYQEAFLTTYRTFVTSLELIQKLIRRYQYLSMANEQTRKKAARNTFSLLVRVVDELSWVEVNRQLIEMVSQFVCRLVQEGNVTFSRLLRGRLLDRVQEKAGFTTDVVPLMERGSSAQNKAMQVLDLRSLSIAQQMTILDAELFQKIDKYLQPAEMLWWVEEQCEEKSPHLTTFTEHFNNVSYWVRTLVVQQPEQRERDKFLVKFIKIMKHLRRLGNFNSYLAILSALDSGPVRRLDWSKNAVDHLKEHSVVMDSSHSFRNYRSLLAETNPPCLPYIGLILQDLTFVHVGNSDILPCDQCRGRKDLLNFTKRWQQFAILDSVRRFKSWHFPLKKDEKIIHVFDNFKHFLSEDEIWHLSELIKPRAGRRMQKTG